MASSNRELADMQDQLTLSLGGVRGIGVTDRELRSAGATLSDIVVKRLDELSEDEQETERGALGEALLALGIGTELTVDGEIARQRWLDGIGDEQ